MEIIKEQDYKIFKEKDNVICEITNNKVKKLNLSNKGITKIIGLDKCKDLEILHCGWNKLSTLDISNNINLKYLWCGWNNLSTLDVSKNKNLQELVCSSNKLTTLDVSNCKNLKELWCYENNLTSLNLSKNINLQWWNYDEKTTKLIDKKEKEQEQELEMEM